MRQSWSLPLVYPVASLKCVSIAADSASNCIYFLLQGRERPPYIYKLDFQGKFLAAWSLGDDVMLSPRRLTLLRRSGHIAVVLTLKSASKELEPAAALAAISAPTPLIRIYRPNGLATSHA
jgi:hypothetical protein